MFNSVISVLIDPPIKLTVKAIKQLQQFTFNKIINAY